MLKVLAVIILLLTLYFFLEVFKRKFLLNAKLTRKAAHVTSGVVVIWLFYFLSYYQFIFVVLFFLLFFLFSHYKTLLTSIHLVERVTYGEAFYPLGVLTTILLSYNNKFIAVTAIAILAISDTVAELAGGNQAKNKTHKGSMAFFASTLIILLISYSLFKIPLTVILILKLALSSLAITIVEMESPYGSDNLTIPLATCLILGMLI